MDLAMNKVENHTEEGKHEELLRYCLSLPPVADIVGEVFFREDLRKITSFLKILYGESYSYFFGTRITFECILKRLGIISKKKYNRLSGSELIEFAFSEKICKLRRSNINYTKLLSHEKINCLLCSKFPNIIFKAVEYWVYDNQFKYFYRDMQPTSHIVVHLDYEITIFRGNESVEELENIHNTWRFPYEQLIDPEGKQAIYTYDGRTFPRGPAKSLELEAMYKKIKQVFVDNDLSRNFLSCSFSKQCGIDPRIPQEITDYELREYKNPIYKDTYHGGEVPYTPILYVINIAFQAKVQECREPPYICELANPQEITKVLETLRIKPANYKRSPIINLRYCDKCRLFLKCQCCCDCKMGKLCPRRECSCQPDDSHSIIEDRNDSNSHDSDSSDDHDSYYDYSDCDFGYADSDY